uniref:Uncharacterized protein n=1 Tax=viral metagenome TaxID=1070528 RepID=A0A6C0LPP2_9ZZZZ
MEQRPEYKTLVNDVIKLRGDVDSAEKSFTNKKDQFNMLNEHVKTLEEHLGLNKKIQEEDEQRKKEQEAEERQIVQERERDEQRQRDEQEKREKDEKAREKMLVEIAKTEQKKFDEDKKKIKILLKNVIESHNNYVENKQQYNPKRTWGQWGFQVLNGIEELFNQYIEDVIALMNEGKNNIYIKKLNNDEKDYQLYMYFEEKYNIYIRVQMLLIEIVEEAFKNKKAEIPIAIKILSSIRYEMLKDNVEYFKSIILSISKANLNDCKDIDRISQELAVQQANIRSSHTKSENLKNKDQLITYILNLVHYYQRRCGNRVRGGSRKTKKTKRNGRKRTTRRA